MKRMAKVLVVLVLALALCQSAMAAPTQAGNSATTNSGNHYGQMDRFLRLLGAIWGGHGAIWGGHGAIWGTHGAIWGGGH